MEIKIVNKLEIPIFNKGDVVKDKFGNLLVIEDMVSTQQLERDSDIYDFMGYRVKIIEKHPSSPARMVGNVSGFHSDDKCMWIYNTREDAVNDEVLVTDAHIFATELSLFDEFDIADNSDNSDNSAKAEDSEESDKVEVSDIPIFLVGNIVKDKFGNIFRIQDVERFKEEDGDNMHYYVELVEQISSVKRYAGMYAEFDFPGVCYWIYDTEEAAVANEVAVNRYYLYATELVLVQSVLQTKSVKPAKAEIAKRYPSIEDLQKMSEENDLSKLLDLAYEILKEQASLGERAANLNFEKFKRCIPHFEREGFDITEHGTLIEVRW